MTGPIEPPTGHGDVDLWPVVRALVAREETRDHEFGLLADAVRRLTEPADPPPAAFSWLDAPGTGRDLAQHLDRLNSWLRRIYLWFAELPECWLWHPVVLQELSVLMAIWDAAHAPGAPIHALGDWHDRYRPRVTERIAVYTKGCALERHQREQRPAAEPPNADQVDVIARWWATAWTQPAPAPAAALIERRQANGRT